MKQVVRWSLVGAVALVSVLAGVAVVVCQGTPTPHPGVRTMGRGVGPEVPKSTCCGLVGVQTAAATMLSSTKRAASPSSTPGGPAVLDSLVLFNNSLLPGNLPAVNGIGPDAVAYDPSKGELFVADMESFAVSVISNTTGKVVAAIPAGSEPDGLAYDSGRGEVFVADYGSGNVSVISVASNSVVATIPVSVGVYAMAYDSAKGEIFVGVLPAYPDYSSEVAVISDTTNSVVATLPLGSLPQYVSPMGLAYDPGQGEVWVVYTNTTGAGFVSAICDGSTSCGGAAELNRWVAGAAVGPDASGIAYDAARSEVFVSDSGAYNVSVVCDGSSSCGGATKVVATVPVTPANGEPWSLAYDPGRGEVFVASINGSVISDTTDSVIATVPLENVGVYTSGVQGVVYDPGRSIMLFASFSSDTVAAVSDELNVVVASIPVGADPSAVVYDTGRGEIFVTDELADVVYVISDSTNKVVATVPVGEAPDALVYDPGRGEVFVLNGESADVSVISDSSNTLVATIPVAPGPDGAAYDPARGEVFVAGWNSYYSPGTVSVISDSTNAVVKTLTVGTIPMGVAYDPARGEVFVVNEGGGGATNVSVISDTTNAIVAKISVGTFPDYIVYDAAQGELFLTNSGFWGGGNLSAISDSTDTVVTTIPLGILGGPTGVAYDPDQGELFVPSVYYSGGNFYGNVSVVSATSNSVITTFPAGQYTTGVTFDAGKSLVYATNSQSGTVSIISPMAFPVTFSKVGLPPGTQWSVNVTGANVYRSTGDTLAFSLPNGTYTYTVRTTNPNWTASGGSFSINGASASGSVTFQRILYGLTVSEVGIPSKTLAKDGWTVGVNGSMHRSTSSEIVFSEPNGTFPILVVGPSGYEVRETATVGVDGNTSVVVTFAKGTTYALGFSEKGLPKGQPWCVTVDGGDLCSTKTSLKFENLTPGSYAYALVSPLLGQNVTAAIGTVGFPIAGTLTISASERMVYTFVYRYAVTFTQTGLSSGTWSVTVKGVTSSNTTTNPIVFDLKNGTYSYKVGAVSGYTSVGSPKPAKVSGAPVAVTITFRSKGGTPKSYTLGMSTPSEFSPASGVYYATLSISPTAGLATSMFGISLVTPAGTAIPVGTAPTTCKFAATGTAFTVANCGAPESGSWYGVLYWAGNGSIANVYSGAGWSTPSFSVSADEELVVISGTSLAGSSDTLNAFSTGSATVAGQSGPF